MQRACRRVAALGSLVLLTVPGCAAMQQLAVLRTLTFTFAGVSDVRVAGIAIGEGSSYGSLGLADAARLGAAVVAKQVPLEMIAHVSAANPAENAVAARMVDMDWTLFVEDHRTLSGGLAGPVAIAPGRTADVPLAVRFDLFELGGGGARDLFDLALAVAGHGTLRKDLRLELSPTVETALGPMRFTAPVVIHRP